MPAYNTGATIEKVFARVPPEARHRIRRYVATNDGSTDDTATPRAVSGFTRSLKTATVPGRRSFESPW